MGQVRSVAVIGTGSAVQQAVAVLKAHPELVQSVEQEKPPLPPTSKKSLTAVERRPDLYIRNQKVDAMSARQLRGELRRAAKRTRLPQELQINEKTGAVKGVSKGALVDAALAVVLKTVLDSHIRGVSPYPR